MLKFAVGLQHRVRVDGQRLYGFLNGRQPVTLGEVTNPKRLLHLMNQLQVRRDP